MEDTSIFLGESAQKRYEQLDDLVQLDRSSRTDSGPRGLIEILDEEEQLLDRWRIQLVDFVHLWVSILANARISGSRPGRDDRPHILGEMLHNLAQIPAAERRMIVRYRGRGIPGERSIPERFDYVIVYGHLIVDLSMIKGLCRRGGVTASHLPGRLLKAYEMLSSLDINLLYLDLGSASDQQIVTIKRSTQILAGYFQALSEGGNRNQGIFYNEQGTPDPNLTLLAGLNDLSPETVQSLVQRINGLMHRPSPNGLEEFTCVYDAIFAFKNLQERLVKPPIEINNVRWLMLMNDQEIFPREKVNLTRLIMQAFGDSPQKTAQVIEGIFGKDFTYTGAQDLGEQLRVVTDFLDILEKDEQKGVVRQTLENVRQGFYRVADEIFDDLIIEGGELKVATPTGVTLIGRIHRELLEMAAFFKRRRTTRKKMKQMLRQAIDFDAQDFETIARDFAVSIDDAKKFIEMLRLCFDERGRFHRRSFEKNIPQFVEHDSNIFEFLWHNLQEINIREDRVAFLNSLQLLIAKMHHPHEALRILLTNFCANPKGVSLSDRNALMLSNILIRKYNKELLNAVETTPEEVLLVKEGLDQAMLWGALDFIERNRERFFNKIRTIHQGLGQAFAPTQKNGRSLPVRNLVSLEREAFIFLALVGGETAHRIIRSAVKEYGSPAAKIYAASSHRGHIKVLLQLLQLSVRGLGRFGLQDDLPILQAIRSQESGFRALQPGESHQRMVERVMGWVDTISRDIAGKRGWG